MGWKWGSSPRKGNNTTLGNVDHEQSLGNCVGDGIDIYIYIYYDGSQYKYIFFYI